MPTKHDNVLNWAEDLDENTLAQAERTARLPFIQGHLALMPDAHLGKGATIGSVIPTKGAIIPAAVGVDIGCGMIATRTGLTSHDLPDKLDELHERISRSIPAGVGQQHTEPSELPDGAPPLTQSQESKARRQIGSLGSGNHFVEICLDETDHVWVVLHSGSRGIGLQLANQHIEAAQGLMKRYFIDIEDRDLAYVVEGTPEFDAYRCAMLWAQDYAMLNRQVMLEAALTSLELFLLRTAPVDTPINCHHNFAALEHHHGHNVWITRKGAIRARVGDRGVIPGSMGTSSFIVTGKGNPASYESCSHGAGRRMSRSKARKNLDVETLRESMSDRTWNDADAEKLIDEDPRAYKDINSVMAAQADLVTIDHELHAILNYKGL